MNTLINKTYRTVWSKLPTVDVHEEDGAEIIEWIALAAVLMIMMLVINPLFETGGDSIGNGIIGAIMSWVAELMF